MLFTQPSFLSSSNIYEVNVRQYTPEGTFNAFIKHLPRLKEMGVEILWFMPIYPIGIVNRKGILGSYYSIKDFTDINPEFGTKEDFKFLILAIHNLGMKIILDWIANHAAWDNNLTYSRPDYFLRNDKGNFIAPYDWTDVIQIDHQNKDEQQAMIKFMEYWITEFGIDGFRADLAHLTPLIFWKLARQRLDTLKPGLIWLAETEDPAYSEVFDITYAWKWMHSTEEQVKKSTDVKVLRNVLNECALLFKNSLRMYFTSNHDENSWNGSEFEKYGIFAKALAIFSCTYINAVPLIYSGQELPNQKRLKFFEKDFIEWDENITLHEFYNILFKYREREPLFKNSEQDCTFLNEDLPLLTFQRISANNAMIVILNLSKVKVTATIHSADATGKFKNIFSGITHILNTEFPVKMLPGDFIVLEKVV